MNKIVFTVIISSLSLPVFAQYDSIVVSGHIQNHTLSTIEITYSDYQEILVLELDDNGNFKASADIEEGYYLLNYGRNTAYIFLHPEDELNLTFDADNFDSTLIFDGKGSTRNNYLVEKSRVSTLLTQDLEAFYKVDEPTFMKNLENVENTHLASLEEFEVEDFFKVSERKQLEYERLFSIQNYTTSYKFYLGEEVQPSQDFYTPVQALRLDNENDYKKQPYYYYLVNAIWNERIDKAPNIDEMIDILRQVPFQDLLINLINNLYSKISPSEERAKDYLDLIKRITTYQPFIESAEKRYLEVLDAKGLDPGDVSPEFSYESVDGQMVSLSDLKGKYIYIDVWATWCAPCIKQVPYLKQLEKKYHDKNIVFVSISVDKEEVKETWKKMIAKKQLGGLQLFADKSFDSEFMNAYAVNSIPRFILIDPEGKIVDTEAPRPSFDKTRTLLDKLLN
ncbi:MAG: TlpA disulfide reductase family protein [Bacteroidota bacterium]